MRKIRLMAVIMSILSCVSVFGIGFSSWFNFEPPVKASTGNYKSYGTAVIENVSMSVFQFSTFSFKDENYTDSDEGKVSVTYKISAESLEFLDDSFKVSITLGYSQILDSTHKLFYHAFEEKKATNECKVFITGGPTDGVDYSITAKDTIYFEHTFKNVDKSNDFEFTVDYFFKVPSADNNFRTTFGKYLVGSEINKEGINPTKFSVVAGFVK